MENKTQTAGKTATESVGATEMQVRRMIEVFPHSNNTRVCVKVLKGEKEE